MDTTALRQNFHADDLFHFDEIQLDYTRYDRLIVGGTVPGDCTLVPGHVAECGTPSILDRREMGSLNVGDAAEVHAGGKAHALGRGDVLYPGMGSGPVTFSGEGRFYLVSAPAHRALPAHLHDRRMEAYLSFDLAAENRVFHFMGWPQETRHIVMKTEDAVISPPWSIPCGCGTGSYTFCWAMAGDNADYKDIEMIGMGDLR